MGKAKPAKHTAKEINAKVAAATTNKGGGQAGKQDRQGGKAGHAKYQCPVCGQTAPDGNLIFLCVEDVAFALCTVFTHQFSCLTPCAWSVGTVKSMQMHHESKHPKLPFEEEKLTNLHEVFGGTTQGVAVRGSTKKK